MSSKQVKYSINQEINDRSLITLHLSFLIFEASPTVLEPQKDLFFPSISIVV